MIRTHASLRNLITNQVESTTVPRWHENLRVEEDSSLTPQQDYFYFTDLSMLHLLFIIWNVYLPHYRYATHTFFIKELICQALRFRTPLQVLFYPYSLLHRRCFIHSSQRISNYVGLFLTLPLNRYPYAVVARFS